MKEKLKGDQHDRPKTELLRENVLVRLVKRFQSLLAYGRFEFFILRYEVRQLRSDSCCNCNSEFNACCSALLAVDVVVSDRDKRKLEVKLKF